MEVFAVLKRHFNPSRCKSTCSTLCRRKEMHWGLEATCGNWVACCNFVAS